MLVVIELIDGRTIECAILPAALERIHRWVGDGGPGKVGLRTLTGTRVWLRVSEVRAVAPREPERNHVPER